MRICLFILLLCLSAPAIAQIDVRRYASDDLFAIKPVVSTEQPAEESAPASSWAQKKYEAALESLNEGDIDKGLSALEDLVRYDPKIPMPHYMMGVVYLENGEFAAARRKFNEALSVEPLFMEAKYMLGILAIEEKEYKTTARNLFESISTIPSYEAMGYHGMALEVLDRGGVSWAITYLEKSIRADSAFMDSYSPLVTLLLYGGQMRKARKYLDQGLRTDPEWERGIVMHGILALLVEEDMDAFESDLDRLIELSPENYHYLFMRAGLLIEKEEWHEAVVQYQEAYTLDGTSGKKFKFTSKIEKDQTLKQAIDYYFDHYEMRSETRRQLEQGICEMIRENYSEAKALFEQANATQETLPGLTFYAVMANQFWENPEQIIAHYDAVIRADSLHTFAYAERGRLFIETGDLSAAFLDYDQLVTQYPEEKEAWKKRGLLLAQLGENEHAFDDFSQALSLDTTDNELYFNRASLGNTLQRYDQAAQDLSALLKRTPEDGEAWHLLFETRLAQHDSLLALAALDSASNYLPNQEDIHLALLQLAERMENTRAVERAYTRLIRANPVQHMYVLERGKFYYENEELEKALTDLENFTKEEKRLGVGYYYLGQVYAAMGEGKKADRNLKKAEKFGYQAGQDR